MKCECVVVSNKYFESVIILHHDSIDLNNKRNYLIVLVNYVHDMNRQTSIVVLSALFAFGSFHVQMERRATSNLDPNLIFDLNALAKSSRVFMKINVWLEQ